MNETQIIQADLTWTGEMFEPDIQVVVEPDGCIEHVGMLDMKPTHRLTNQAIIPGFIDAHGHAFQRGLRGRGETFPEGAGSFWSWREAMYELVATMDSATMYRLNLQTFRELLLAGVTTVGEFHYLHHDSRGKGYAFDEVVLQAAADAGIRIVLLECYYRTGGINQPLSDAQRRFESKSPADFWEQVDRVSLMLRKPTQSLGVAPHSIRAAPPEDILAMYEEAKRRDLVVHAHVEEQPKEIADCVQAYGLTPMALLNEQVHPGESFTAIHCTHTRSEDMQKFMASGGGVCLCPLTEGNLGDGVADVAGMQAAGGRLCIGTDSNARLCMTEELRWLEYVQRLGHERRGVMLDARGNVAHTLLRAATSGGAAALGLRSGRIAPGCQADFAVIDLSAPALTGWTVDTLLESFIFGTGNDAIAGVCVGGRWLPATRGRRSDT